MAAADKSKQYNPLAVNILRLQKYNFDYLTLEEVVFFEYLVVKAVAFGHKPFYHSVKTIADETGIKRIKHATIVKKFVENGWLEVETKGFPKVKFFSVNFNKISKSLSLIYQSALYDKLSVDFDKLFAYFDKLSVDFDKQKELIEGTLKKKPKKETLEKEDDDEDESAIAVVKNFNFSLGESKIFIDNLEKAYNTRRKEKDNKYPTVTLGFKTDIRSVALDAMNMMGPDLINDAWLVYTDKMLDKELKVARILPYFFSRLNGKYDVINAMADIHNTSYVYGGG